MTPATNMKAGKAAPFTLAPLPYEQNALEPYISARTLSYHYSKHHKGYVDKLNELVAGTNFEGMKLEEVIKETAGKAGKTGIFNNAAQVWNHDFYWRSLSPTGGGKPPKRLAGRIDADFGGFEKFLEQFAQAGMKQFGTGWAWLVEKGGKLTVTNTGDAENPLSQGQGKPLLTLDVWEHAYYLDYQNRRQDYLAKVLEKLLNWEFAEKQIQDS